MTIYNVPPYAKKSRAFRLVGYGTVALLLGGLFLSTWPPMFLTEQLSRIVGWSTLTIALVVIFTLPVLNSLTTRRTGRESLQYELSEGRIALRYQGQLKIEIPLTEIATLTERSGCLFICSAEPVRQIAIPRDVAGFDDLKSVLGTYRGITPSAQMSRFGSLILYVVASVAMVLLFATKNRAVVVIAASTVLLLQVIGFISYFRIREKISPLQIVLLLTSLVLFWLLTGWILTIRGLFGD